MLKSEEIARSYIARGLSPIPIHTKTKGPNFKNWNLLRITQETVTQHFTQDPMNVGVILGEASRGLVDVDLDCPEALNIAPLLFPPSKATFGRASKRKSHLLYLSDLYETQDVATIQFKDPEKKNDNVTLLELRIGAGDRGAQTVFPGSIHTSGEQIEWDNGFGEIEFVPGATLLICAKLTAACCLFARNYPPKGEKHEAAKVLGGFLARCGLNEDRVAILASAIATSCQVNAHDLIASARSAAREHFEGGNAYGLPAARETFSKKAADKIAGWLEYKAPPSASVLTKDADGFVRVKGNIAADIADNVAQAIANLGVTLRYNEFATRVEIKGLEGFDDGPLTDHAAIRIRMNMQRTFGFMPRKELFEDCLVDIAKANQYHPVKDFFDSLRWDGETRIDNWLKDYGGAQDTEYVRAVSRKTLVAAVRRIREPGVKFDTMLVLESPQGKLKSTAVEILAINREWYTDNLPLGADTKEVIEQIQGKWIVEFPELTGIRKSDVNHMKSFLSRGLDSARLAYGRHPTPLPRQMICIGTCNDSEYLRDDENRRFWPVKIEKFNVHKLKEDVLQLWAEAVVYEANGESLLLPESLWAVAATEQEERKIGDPIFELLVNELGMGGEDCVEGRVSALHIWEILDVPKERRAPQMLSMGKAMQKLGFVKKEVTKTALDGRVGEILRKGQTFYQRGESETFIERGMLAPKCDATNVTKFPTRKRVDDDDVPF